MKIPVALIDDHAIFCDSLSSLINNFEGFSVSWYAQDGMKAIQLLEIVNKPNFSILPGWQLAHLQYKQPLSPTAQNLS